LFDLFPSSIRTHKGGAESGIVEGFISEDGNSFLQKSSMITMFYVNKTKFFNYKYKELASLNSRIIVMHSNYFIVIDPVPRPVFI
jgi:hypothetical protein